MTGSVGNWHTGSLNPTGVHLQHTPFTSDLSPFALLRTLSFLHFPFHSFCSVEHPETLPTFARTPVVITTPHAFEVSQSRSQSSAVACCASLARSHAGASFWPSPFPAACPACCRPRPGCRNTSFCQDTQHAQAGHIHHQPPVDPWSGFVPLRPEDTTASDDPPQQGHQGPMPWASHAKVARKPTG